MALKYLGEIKSSVVKELYAMTYSKIFEYGKGWESEDKEDIKTLQEIHELYKSLDDSAKTKMQLSQMLFEKYQDAEYSTYQRKIRDMVKEIVFEGLKKIPEDDQRYLAAAKLLLKDKIDMQTLRITIPHEEDSYRDDVIITFETSQKMTVGKNLADLINKVSKNYYSLKDITVDGNKIEVLLS